MRKILFTFLLILIIENSYESECTKKVADQSEDTTNSNSQQPTNISTSQEATSDPSEGGSKPSSSSKSSTENESETSSQSSSVSPTSSQADTSEKSASESSSTILSDSTTSSISPSPEPGNLRSLAKLLDTEDCKSLKTQDDDKYQCVVSSDRKRCEEVAKENSSRLFLSFIFAIIFIIF